MHCCFDESLKGLSSLVLLRKFDSCVLFTWWKCWSVVY